MTLGLLPKMDFFYMWMCLNVLMILINCEDWTRVRTYSKITTRTLNTVVDQSTIDQTSSAASLIQCSLICLRHGQSATFYYEKEVSKCHCSTVENVNTVFMQGTTTNEAIVHGKYNSVQKWNRGSFTKYNLTPLRSDCRRIFEEDFKEDGVYNIQGADGASIDAWCDMQNGGFTVIQRRQDGSENFYRDWVEYEAGFGNRTGEYWIGLRHMHFLTADPAVLHIDLETFGDKEPTRTNIRYSSFSVDSQFHGYKLIISGYYGCSSRDALAHSNGMLFSTRDRDNDLSTANCAVLYGGAWWFNNCHECHLNGIYYQDPNLSSAQEGSGITWILCYSDTYSLKKSVMKIIRV